ALFYTDLVENPTGAARLLQVCTRPTHNHLPIRDQLRIRYCSTRLTAGRFQSGLYLKPPAHARKEVSSRLRIFRFTGAALAARAVAIRQGGPEIRQRASTRVGDEHPRALFCKLHCGN